MTDDIATYDTGTLLSEFDHLREILSPDPDQRLYDVERMLVLARELQKREKAPPRHPRDLTADDLVEIVRSIQSYLWLDRDDDGALIWNRDKAMTKERTAWTLGLIGNLLAEHGLRPGGTSTPA